MLLTPTDLSTFSRLLGEALDLQPTEWEAWFGSITGEHRHLIPQLQEMLAEHLTPDHPGFLADGPRLDSTANSASAAQPGDRVGPYRLLREIGRGGMSSVWLAERPDGIVKRNVALKMPLLTLTSASQVERFERERDVLALLAHPQIARLYDAGVTPSGQPFIVLEHVDGLPITAACDARQWGVPQRLQIFLGVLAAVDHAHKHLVVHRDIKPSNVFVDTEGHVKLLDFGIAKLLTDPLGTSGPSALTRDAGCALTPSHAAPEQLNGQAISTATDVYSLGVLLYELLTGVLPQGDAHGSMAQALAAALHTMPERPSLARFDAAAAAHRGLADPARLRLLLNGDLDTIVMKALRKGPADRFGSIEAFADDLKRYLDHRPIGARPSSLLYRCRLFLRRHHRVGLAAMLGFVGVVGFAATAYQQRAQSLGERARADSVRDFMFDLVGDAEPDESHSSAEVTGRQMVDRAVLRARTEFSRQPRLQGELLGELGRIYGRLGDPALAARLLDEALVLLEANAPASDPVFNDMRAQRAVRALENNDMALASRLANSALSGCVAPTRDCAKVRAYASNVLSKAAVRAGRVDDALRLMNTSLVNSEAGFGAHHSETALTLVNLAVIERNAGRLMEANAVLERALALSSDLTLRASDRIEISRTKAILDFDLGRFESARARLTELVAATPYRSERMLQLRFLADTYLALGEPGSALDRADAAIALATPAEHGSTRVLFARQSRARALGLLGRAPDALPEMTAVLSGLRAAGYAPNTAELLRGRRLAAELMARGGDLAGARSALNSVLADHTRAQPGFDIERGLALDLLGCVARTSGQAAEATALHAKARTLLEMKWPADHVLLERNALYLEAARMNAEPSDAARTRFARQAEHFVQPFGGTSRWRSIIDMQLAPAKCLAAGQAACALIL